MSILIALLLFGGFVSMLRGVASLSNATAGVGGIAVACFLAIVARIAQASAHHAEMRKLVRPGHEHGGLESEETTP